jgi:hypothetical protein
MKTEALEELIEHCKHIGGIDAIFLKERIIVAEEELKAIKASEPRENFCKLHNTNYGLVGYCPICHPNR